MVNHLLMCVRHAIRVVLRVKEIKTTVQVALEIFPSSQISVMLIVPQDIFNRLVSALVAIPNALYVDHLLLTAVLVQLTELMNHF